jgi:hypothetical protein
MEIETLLELINAFQSLGDEAKEAFVWYLLLEYVPSFVLGTIWTVIGGVTIVRIVRLLQSLVTSEQLCRAAGHEAWTEARINEACDKLRT